MRHMRCVHWQWTNYLDFAFFSFVLDEKDNRKILKKVQEKLKLERIRTKNILAFRMQIYEYLHKKRQYIFGCDSFKFLYSGKLLYWDFRTERKLTPINMTSSECKIALPWTKYYEKHVDFTLCWTVKRLNFHMDAKTSVNVSQRGFLFVHMCPMIMFGPFFLMIGQIAMPKLFSFSRNAL